MELLQHLQEVHLAWKVRFLELLERMEQSVSDPGLPSESLPTLGAWLEEGERGTLGRTTEFHALYRAYSRFYRLAGAITILGVKDARAARVALESEHFTVAWTQLLRALSAMRQRLQQECAGFSGRPVEGGSTRTTPGSALCELPLPGSEVCAAVA